MGHRGRNIFFGLLLILGAEPTAVAYADPGAPVPAAYRAASCQALRTAAIWFRRYWVQGTEALASGASDLSPLYLMLVEAAPGHFDAALARQLPVSRSVGQSPTFSEAERVARSMGGELRALSCRDESRTLDEASKDSLFRECFFDEIYEGLADPSQIAGSGAGFRGRFMHIVFESLNLQLQTLQGMVQSQRLPLPAQTRKLGAGLRLFSLLDSLLGSIHHWDVQAGRPCQDAVGGVRRFSEVSQAVQELDEQSQTVRSCDAHDVQQAAREIGSGPWLDLVDPGRHVMRAEALRDDPNHPENVLGTLLAVLPGGGWLRGSVARAPVRVAATQAALEEPAIVELATMLSRLPAVNDNAVAWSVRVASAASVVAHATRAAADMPRMQWQVVGIGSLGGPGAWLARRDRRSCFVGRESWSRALLPVLGSERTVQAALAGMGL